MKKLLPYVFGAVMGALLLFQTAWPETFIPYPEVIVPARRIIEREPDTVRTFVDRIRYVRVEPTMVARAPDGARDEVLTFCEPTMMAAAPPLEAPPPIPAPRLLVRSGTFDPGWWFQKDALLLTGPTSHGDLKAFDYRTRGSFTFRTTGDSLIVRYPRTALFREAAEIAAPFLLGVGLCFVFCV